MDYNEKLMRATEAKFYKQIIRPASETGTLQKNPTPIELTGEIIEKLKSCCGDSFADLSYCVLFNVEFVYSLVIRGVPPGNITFYCDSPAKEKVVRDLCGNRVPVGRVLYVKGEGITLMPKNKRQFDVIVMNPPFQAQIDLSKEGGKKKGTRGGDLWSKFVSISLSLVKEGGYVCNVHPSSWRKPEHELFPAIRDNQVLYLEMHGEKDGKKVFGAVTSFDFYVLKKTRATDKTTVVDVEGKKHTIDLRQFSFLPSSDFDIIDRITAKEGEEKCEVLFSYSEYETRKTWMSDKQSTKFKYPCVHSMTKDGLVFWYSSKKGEFIGVPKVILSFGRYQYPLNDFEGQDGMTQIAFGLKIRTKEEGDNIVKAISSEKFQRVLLATKWSSFQTDWRMFKYFRADFWKEFI